MKLPSLILPSLPESPTLDPQLRRWAEDITRYLLDFNEKAKEIPFNNSEEIEYTTNATANAEDQIQHHLNRVPHGYIILENGNGGVLYNGTTAWTTKYIYLKCTTASNHVKILVF